MSKTNFDANIFIGGLGFIVGLVGVGYAIGTRSKLAKISERLNTSIDVLADTVEIDISEELINRAVEKAANTAVKGALAKATNEAVDEARHRIRREVVSAIDKEYETIRDSVLRETNAAASKIDVNKVRRDVEKAAEKMALDKFDANLDGILAKFNNDLDNTAKIYSTIKSTMIPATNSNREFVVKLG